MKKAILILAGLGLLVGKALAQEPRWQEISRGMVNARAVLVDANPKIIYLGTDRGIFKAADGGDSWRNVFSIGGDNHNINYLAFDEQDEKIIYAATGAGLYFSVNQGQRWSRIFRGKNSAESDCVNVLSLPRAIYLGTKSGLFESKDKGRSWRKVSGKLGDTRVYNIVCSLKEDNYIYVACVDGVFKSADSGVSWERIYATHPVENGAEPEEENEDRDEEARHSEVRYIAIDPNQPQNLYLATSRGIYWSKNRGNGWELLSEPGLLSRDIQFLLFSGKSKLYAAAKSGIFLYKEDGWRELSFNLSCRYVSFIGLDNEFNLYACTEKGLFKSSAKRVSLLQRGDLTSDYSNFEPSIEEVQKQAIKYAEVDPQKIIHWRKQARKKAILPQVSIGLDRNSGDLWHWEAGSSTKCDDDTLRRGRETLDWDVRLSWDLGELIWNNDQTSIDTRSRLMVQLRDDILDEVNKTYFERIRVKMELDNLQIEDKKKRFEKELRFRELTASLDALTGGYFSRQIRANNTA